VAIAPVADVWRWTAALGMAPALTFLLENQGGHLLQP